MFNSCHVIYSKECKKEIQKVIRKTTCSNGNICDYAICGDKDSYIKKHEEYIEDGYRKNK